MNVSWFSAFSALTLLTLVSTVGFSDPNNATILKENRNSKPYAELIPGKVYRGAMPRTDDDFELLKSKGIKTVLNLGVLHWQRVSEEALAKKYNIDMKTVVIFPGPIEPQKSVRDALKILEDESNYPIYFHCLYGRDRTSLVAGLFRLEHQNWSLDDTWEEMKYYNFDNSIQIIGLYNYFKNHALRATAPDEKPAAQSLLNDFKICAGASPSTVTTAQQCLDIVHQKRASELFESSEKINP
jgi:protein tyrosine/serine phosphatase